MYFECREGFLGESGSLSNTEYHSLELRHEIYENDGITL
jgi:hypothetical protein